jgi:hypothetical protein
MSQVKKKPYFNCGGSVAYTSFVGSKYGTALRAAMDKGRKAVVELLRENGAAE